MLQNKYIMKESVRTHIAWIDLLRIIACFFVVCSHCSDPFLVSSERSDFVGGWIVGSVVRCSVPLFVMMSGALLLPTSLGLGAFYTKRIRRLAVPLIFWSIVLPFLFYLYMNVAGGSAFPLLDSSAYTLESACRKAFTFFLNFNYDTTPLWYLYMLIGLYFIIPILSTWIKNAPRIEVKNVLILWGITLFLPYIELAAKELGFIGYPGNSQLLGMCEWNIFGTFYYVSGFVGYLLLGYYWKTYPPQWNWTKTLCICIPAWATGWVITYFSLDMLVAYLPQHISFAWHFAIAHVFLLTLPVYIVVQKINIKPSRILAKVASTTLGIYLCHFIFIHIGYDMFQEILPSSTPSVIHVLLNSICTFVVCYLLVSVLMQFKLTRKLVE